jgi:drug/metabolite transporter (DMT)-like permease
MQNVIKRSLGPTEWTLLIALGLIWGASYFFFAIALNALPVFTIVWLRIAIAASALWVLVIASGIALPRDRTVWRDFLLLGLLNNAIPFSLIVYSQTQIASGLAAVLNGVTPFFTVLAANALTRDEKFSANRLAGSIVGLAGVASMIGFDAVSTLGQAIWPQLAAVAASLTYAFSSIFARRFSGQPPLLTAAGQTTGSTLLMLPVMLMIDRPWTITNPGLGVWAAILGLALICTSLAYVMFFEILKRAGATNVQLVTFLVPVSAILLGIAFLGESLKPQHILGMAAIGLGLALIDGRLFARLRRA